MKRPRTEKEHDDELLSQDGIHHWMNLPVEMLTEIFSFLASPDILALARTNTFFFNLLVKNERFQYVWIEARKRFIPAPIPAPAMDFTEASLIAFLFDPSPCSNCGKITHRPHFSYSLKVRACRLHCEKRWRESQLQFVPAQVASERASVRAVQSWLPSFEVFTSNGSTYHRETWLTEVQEYERSLKDPIAFSALQQSYAQKAKRLSTIMEYSSRLLEWAKLLRSWLRTTSRQNRLLLDNLRKSNIWDEHIFRNTSLYSKLLSWKKSTRETVTSEEIKRYEPEFKSQVMALSKKRINASICETIRLNQVCLRNYWNALNSSSKDSLLSYPEFRKLAIVKVLEKTNTDKSGAIEFARHMSQSKQHEKAVQLELKKNKAICSHVKREMQSVLDMKRTQLAQKLGYSPEECAAISSEYVHPAERITSWFTCRRCVGFNHPMEFHEVAQHQCRGLTGRRDKGAWCADWFLPHPQAINAGKECLRVLSKSEATFRLADLSNIRHYFLCKSCSVPIVLWADKMIFYHCQRHDSPKLEVISAEEAQKHMRVSLDEARAVTSNVHKKTKCAKKLRQQKLYGCRHCESNERLPLFTYDGLQSHLKAKHGLSFPSFEDIKYISPVSG